MILKLNMMKLQILFSLSFFLITQIGNSQNHVGNPEGITHFEVNYFQGGIQVDCINPYLPLDIVVIDSHGLIDQESVVMFSFDTGNTGLSIKLRPFVEGESHYSFDAEYFDNKDSSFSGYLRYLVILFGAQGDLFLYEEIDEIPFCLINLKDSFETEERENTSNQKSIYYLFNSAGQIVKTTKAQNKFNGSDNLGLPGGIYFLFEKSENDYRFIRRIIF